MDKVQLLKNSYYNWLKDDGLSFFKIDDDYIAIDTPFLDKQYDNISLYARFINNDTVELSDFGYTLFNLEEEGIFLSKRAKTTWNIFQKVLQDFGITFENNTLLIRTSINKFPVAKSRMLQAILRINDISYLNSNNLRQSFNELLNNWLKKNSILFTYNIEVPNSDGISSHFDFSIPTKSGAEKLVKTSTRPNDLTQAKVFNYDVQATEPVRNNAQFIFLLDNYSGKTKTINSDTRTTALRNLNPQKAEVVGYNELLSKKAILSN